MQNQDFTKKQPLPHIIHSDLQYHKCTFSALLQEKKSHIPSIINEINTSKLPIFLFGAGARADVTLKVLRKYGIVDINEVVVSDNYFKNNLLFNNKYVKPFNSTINEYKMVNVIIGLTAHALEIADALSKHVKVNKIFFIDVRLDERCASSEFVMSYINDNDDMLYDFYKNLSDDKSRKTMCAYFNQTISGMCNYINDVYESNQYFPNFIKLYDNEVFVDCGAYDGDTVCGFLSALGDKKYTSIYAFEPDDESFDKLTKLCNTVCNLYCYKIGTWHESNYLFFSHSGGHGSAIVDADPALSGRINVDTIDNIVKNDRVTYIKMDVEGAEFNSIRGAEITIKKNKPKLAISAYHRLDDLVLIPALLKTLVPEYKFYLRAHFRPFCDELVLYAL